MECAYTIYSDTGTVNSWLIILFDKEFSLYVLICLNNWSRFRIRNYFLKITRHDIFSIMYLFLNNKELRRGKREPEFHPRGRIWRGIVAAPHQGSGRQSQTAATKTRQVSK